MNFTQKVHYVCNLIPFGKVVSYGQIAIIIGSPKASRGVGRALSRCQDPLPAHRVVNKDGYLSGAGAFTLENEQESLLCLEGVEVIDHQVNLEKYAWKPEIKQLEDISYAIGSVH